MPMQVSVSLKDHDLGISLVDNLPQEIAYITLHGPLLELTSTETMQTFRFTVGMGNPGYLCVYVFISGTMYIYLHICVEIQVYIHISVCVSVCDLGNGTSTFSVTAFPFFLSH